MGWMRAMVMLLAVAALPAGADDLDQRVFVKPGGHLQVDLDLGEEIKPEQASLQVISHDADQVRVRAQTLGWGSGDVKFRLEQDERAVRVYGSVSGLFTMVFGGPTIRVRIWVPREFSVDLRSTTGSIRVEELAGKVRARTLNGDIEIVGVDGPLILRTARGGVSVSETRGDVAIRAGEGGIEVSWVTGSVRASTGRGSVRGRHIEGPVEMRTDEGEISLQQVRGRIDAKTESGAVYAGFLGSPEGEIETRRGSVEITIPRDAAIDLDMRSADGSVRLDSAFEIDGERAAGHVIGQLNGGGSSLRVYTARGNVRLDRR